jgi:hypothetical protein
MPEHVAHATECSRRTSSSAPCTCVVQLATVAKVERERLALWLERAAEHMQTLPLPNPADPMSVEFSRLSRTLLSTALQQTARKVRETGVAWSEIPEVSGRYFLVQGNGQVFLGDVTIEDVEGLARSWTMAESVLLAEGR